MSVRSSLILSSLCVIVGLAGVGYRRRGSRLVTPAHLFAIYFLAFEFVGTCIYYAQDPDTFGKTLRISSLGFAAFGIAVALARVIFRSSELRAEIDAHRGQWRLDPREARNFTVIAVVGTALAAMYFVHAGSIPLLAGEVEAARTEAVHGNGFFMVGLTAVLPLVAMAFAIDAISRGKWRLRGFIWIAITLVLMLMTALKDVIPVFFLELFFFSQFVRRGRGVRSWALPVVSLIVALTLAGFTMKHQFQPTGSEGEATRFATEKLTDRVVLWGPRINQFIVSSFPVIYPHRLGGTFVMDLTASRSLGGSGVGFGGWITGQLHPEDLGNSAETVPAMMEFYANFGELFTYVLMFLLGLFVEGFFVSELRRAFRSGQTRTLVIGMFLSFWTLTLAVNAVFGYILYIVMPMIVVRTGLSILRGKRQLRSSSPTAVQTGTA